MINIPEEIAGETLISRKLRRAHVQLVMRQSSRMFVGHYAVAFAAKRVTRRTSLGVLILAAQWIDLLWPVFLLVGLEHVRIAPGITRFTPLDFYDYPFSHSLVAVIGWSILFGAVAFFLRRDSRAALVCAALVLSHWLLDALVHRPDLPVGIRGPYVGLGLWNNLPLSFATEGALLIIGLWIYMRTTIANDRIGRFAFITLVVLMVLFWVPGPFGPPPPSDRAVAWLGIGQWLLIALAFWIDAHRRSARDRLVA